MRTAIDISIAIPACVMMDHDQIVAAIDRLDRAVDRRRQGQRQDHHGAVTRSTSRRGAFHCVVLKPLFTLIR